MNRIWTCLVITALSYPAAAMVAIETHKQVLVDFTQPEGAAKMVSWTDVEHVRATHDGLGWDGNANKHRDIIIETRQPTAIGWSWRPVTSVSISAEVVAHFHSNKIDPRKVAGDLYVRYSPDRKHWSTWQALDYRSQRSRTNPRLRFGGTLRVPRRARQNYQRLLNEFVKTRSGPAEIDQEAAVHWIVDRNPEFFSQEIPFIGHLQFLWETSIGADTRLRQLKIDIRYNRSGVTSAPPGHNDDAVWRFGVPLDKPDDLKRARELSRSDAGKTITVRPGMPIVINLPGNVTTGYAWKPVSITGSAVTSTGRVAYEEKVRDQGGRSAIIGSGGTFRAPFRAVKTGTSIITLAYVRPWEEGKAPIEEFTVTIQVK